MSNQQGKPSENQKSTEGNFSFAKEFIDYMQSPDTEVNLFACSANLSHWVKVRACSVSCFRLTCKNFVTSTEFDENFRQ